MVRARSFRLTGAVHLVSIFSQVQNARQGLAKVSQTFSPLWSLVRVQEDGLRNFLSGLLIPPQLTLIYKVITVILIGNEYIF